MNKPETIESWLEQLGQPSADRDYKPGHQRMHDLLAAAGLKPPKLRIRIAGTNGKGSTAMMLASALKACGLKVGLYTSPHIHSFNERIRINGESLSNTSLMQMMDELMPTALEIGASYFETATALALKHFSHSQVDVEILEAGVGARLDATTAVEADMALITPIALDHQNWLGDTLTEIASEKAHATDGCRFALSALQYIDVHSVLLHHCPTLEFIHPVNDMKLNVYGAHQKQNAALAWAAVQRLEEEGFVQAQQMEQAKEAIEALSISGRLQKVFHDRATIWLDAAHNRHAVEALLPTLKALNLDCVMIFTREDRDLTETIELIRPYAKRMVGEKGEGLDQTYASITEALKQELQINPKGNYLILGSFITVAAALSFLQAQ